MIVKLNETDATMLKMLAECKDEKPPEPDSEIHTGYQLESVARAHYEWERRYYGLRAFLGARILSQVLRTFEEETDEDTD